MFLTIAPLQIILMIFLIIAMPIAFFVFGYVVGYAKVKSKSYVNEKESIG